MPRAATTAPDSILGDAIDLRRKTSRELAERLVERASLLPKPERALIEAVFRDGMSVSRVSALSVESPEPAARERAHRALRRRVRRITARLTSPEFEFVARYGRAWQPTRRRIGTAWAIEGLSFREIANRLGLSVHAVRGQVLAIEALRTEATRGGAA